MNISEKTQKVLNIVLKVFSILLVAFTVFIMLFTIITVTTVDKNDRSLFGLKFFIVQTDSMSKSDKNADLKVHFNAGDIIVAVAPKDPRKLEAGDVISFVSTNDESYGETVTHMIRSVKYSASGGVLGYVTYGTNTGVDDAALVEPEYIIGVYKGKLPGVGYFFQFLRSVPGYIVCILVPFMILIIYNGVNFVKSFKRYKKEQNAELEAEKAHIEEEKARIEAERLQNAELLKELQLLKQQLQGTTTNTTVDSSTTDANKE